MFCDMDFPLISIIVPVYMTHVDLLRSFFKSALSQSLTDIELIAVNDASPDDCPQILENIASKDDRVSVIHRSVNGRAGMARNDGLNIAKGRYILFADADDYMRPDMCETLVRLGDGYHADIVCCSFTIRDRKGRHIGDRRLLNRVYDLSLPRKRAMVYNGMTFALWDKIFRREVISSLRFQKYEANIGEDTVFNVSAFCRSRVVVTTGYPGYEYTVHSSSATGRERKGMVYLRTIASSSKCIRQIVEQEDGSPVGKRFADFLDLKRFSTGCGWIAENPCPDERDAMWTFWRRYLREEILPKIRYRKFLAMWFEIAGAINCPSMVYRLTWNACRISAPLSLLDRLRVRMSCSKLYSSYFNEEA